MGYQGWQVQGVLVCPKGTEESTFSYNLVKATINEVNAYALLQGIKQRVVKSIKKLIMVEDLALIIKHLYSGTFPSHSRLSLIYKKIYITLESILEFQALHVFSLNSHEVNDLENLAISTEEGTIQINGRELHFPIP